MFVKFVAALTEERICFTEVWRSNGFCLACTETIHYDAALLHEHDTETLS